MQAHTRARMRVSINTDRVCVCVSVSMWLCSWLCGWLLRTHVGVKRRQCVPILIREEVVLIDHLEPRVGGVDPCGGLVRRHDVDRALCVHRHVSYQLISALYVIYVTSFKRYALERCRLYAFESQNDFCPERGLANDFVLLQKRGCGRTFHHGR